MKLVFIHGWGFDASFWDTLAPLLCDYEQERIDYGFFGKLKELQSTHEPALLIGHSLGFVHGLRIKQDWAGWIAINSFPRFVRDEKNVGSVTAATLRAMKLQLQKNPDECLSTFHRLIDSDQTLFASPNVQLLSEGLDELRDSDITSWLATNTTPSLILATGNDPLVPPRTTEAMGTTHTETHWHSTGGHVLPQNDPAWCAEKIIAFLQKHFGDAA